MCFRLCPTFASGIVNAGLHIVSVLDFGLYLIWLNIWVICFFCLESRFNFVVLVLMFLRVDVF